MALPYETPPLDPFEVADPAIEAEALRPAQFPAIDPFVEELEAQLAAEQAAAEAQQQPIEQAPGPADFSEAQAASDRFDALAGGPMDPAMEAEIMGGGAPSPPEALPGTLPGTLAPDVVTGADAGLPPVVDAVSGAGAYIEPPSDVSDADALMVPEIDLEPAVIPAQDLTDEALQMRALEFQQQADAKREGMERDAAAKTAQRKLDIARVYEDRLADADKRSEAIFKQSEDLAREKIDRGRFVDDMSWGQKAAGILSVLAGGQLGIISGRGGNEALDFFLGEIDRDVEEQKFNIESGRADIARQEGLVADLYRQSGNSFQAAETARLAMYEAATAELDNQVARLNPEGAQAVEMEMKKRQIQAAAQAQRAKVMDAQREQARKDAELEIEAYDKQSAIDKRSAEIGKIQAETAKLGRRPGTGRAKPKVGGVAEQEHLVATGYLPYKDKNGLRIPAPGEEAAALRAAAPADTKGVKEGADARKAVAEAARSEREAVAANVTDPSRKDSPLTNNDGSLFGAKTVPEATAIRKGMAGAQKMRTAVDDMKALIREGGGASEILGSDEYQRIQSTVTGIDLANAVNLGLGAISKDDLKILINYRGGSDPTSFLKNATVGLETMATNFENGINTELTGQGYSGESWSPVRKNVNVAHERSTDDLLGKAASPVPQGLDLSPDERAKYIQNAAEDIGVAAKRKERRGLDYLKQMEELPDYLTKEERMTIGVPLVMGNRSINGRFRAIRELMGVEGLNDGQRLNLRKDPAFLLELETLDEKLKEAGAFKGAGFSAFDTFKIVTGRAKDDE